ncbi:hypothetical protein F4777DRAFT_577210 [Nemania sp. FL0916]|nr:hypothetical protein F4777DRAFT_577210 [Nemania sp. FL0916]
MALDRNSRQMLFVLLAIHPVYAATTDTPRRFEDKEAYGCSRECKIGVSSTVAVMVCVALFMIFSVLRNWRHPNEFAPEKYNYGDEESYIDPDDKKHNDEEEMKTRTGAAGSSDLRQNASVSSFQT